MMCDVEDWPVIGRYTLQDAMADGLLVPLTAYQEKPVVATSNMIHEVTKPELRKLFHRFLRWDKYAKPGLPEEEQLFHMTYRGQRVWVMEDSEAYTIMYPEDY